MLDYRGIEALYTVIALQSFDRAAEKLCITQSAISQRIKSLENYYGLPLLSRSLPYRPTEFGGSLISHYKKIVHLEETLVAQLQEMQVIPKISIAINRDSLETWFQQLFSHLRKVPKLLLDIIADDQEITLDYLKKGLVIACLSTSNHALPGAGVSYLGNMDYLLVAAPKFYQQYFNNNHSISRNLLDAPVVLFDYHDKTHALYLEKYFNIHEPAVNTHFIPSVSGFKQFTLQGYGYALIPKIDIVEELNSGQLVVLFPNKIWKMRLYWHFWPLASPIYKTFNELVIKLGQRLFH